MAAARLVLLHLVGMEALAGTRAALSDGMKARQAFLFAQRRAPRKPSRVPLESTPVPPACTFGRRAGDACCAASCGQCSECQRDSPCCAQAIRAEGRVCKGENDTACVVPGALEAAAELCFWIQHPELHTCQSEGWVRCASERCATIDAKGSYNGFTAEGNGATKTGCLRRAMEAAAAAQGLSPLEHRHSVLQRCMGGTCKACGVEDGTRHGTLPRRAGRQPRPPTALRQALRRRCPPRAKTSPVLPRRANRTASSAGARVVIAGIVRDQSWLLRYWVLWHLVVGAHHVLVYDNGSTRESGVSRLLAPLVELGAVTLVPWRAHRSQLLAYEDAVRRAPTLGGDFVAALDVDELFVPHADGCVGAFVRGACRDGQSRCGGVHVNRMLVRSCAGVAPRSASALESVGFALGELEPLTKSVMRVAAPHKWNTPHAAMPEPPWCLVGEQGDQCIKYRHMPWHREPCTGHSAFVYHLHTSTLLDWVIKRSVVGRIDLNGGNPCPTCFGALEDLAREYSGTCRHKTYHRANNPCIGLRRHKPYPNASASARFREAQIGPYGSTGLPRPRVAAFLRSVDEDVARALALLAVSEPSGSANAQ